VSLISLASPKGGVGKTTIAANLGHALARTGRRVILLDLDPQNALRLYFGSDLRDPSGFTCRLAERPAWREAMQGCAPNLFLLPYGPCGTRTATEISFSVAQNQTLLAGPVSEMLSDPDVHVLVDTPPGPSPLLLSLLPLTDLLVTILLVDAASAALVPALAEGGIYGDDFRIGRKGLGFVLNQFDPRTRLGPVIAEAAEQQLGRQLLGIVYRDECVSEAAAAQKAVAEYAPSSKAAHDLGRLSMRLLDEVGVKVPGLAAV
jgi:cellulose synthase operon protein YhjQ